MEGTSAWTVNPMGGRIEAALKQGASGDARAGQGGIILIDCVVAEESGGINLLCSMHYEGSQIPCVRH